MMEIVIVYEILGDPSHDYSLLLKLRIDEDAENENGEANWRFIIVVFDAFDGDIIIDNKHYYSQYMTLNLKLDEASD